MAPARAKSQPLGEPSGALTAPGQIGAALLSMGWKASPPAPTDQEDAMTAFAKQPRSRLFPALEIATVIAALLLGASFGARFLVERSEPGAAPVIEPTRA